jgi:CelD/BcsL family acetyltransferase involved in cellulose biosynthesis
VDWPRRASEAAATPQRPPDGGRKGPGAILAGLVSSPCFSPVAAASEPVNGGSSPQSEPAEPEALVARPVRFADIARADWDRLVGRTPAATPFSRWTVHRAWWDAYGATAHEQYLVSTPADDDGDVRGIVPLMHRHEQEPDDSATATALRRRFRLAGTPVRPDAKAIFFGASYHADYATVLAAPADLTAVARATASALGAPPDPARGGREWDVVDLRRLRDDDPALPALEEAFRACAPYLGWDVCTEQEDVCPVLEFPEGDWDAYLATLSKSDRHEIRRKWRRLEASGDVAFTVAGPGPEVADRFIQLHQARWGAEGLFPDTEGGRRSRTFVNRLVELEAAEGDRAQLQFGRLDVGGRTIFIGVGFDDGTTCYFYNAGNDPAARELSPGVNGTAAYLRNRLEAGRRRFDFLRGDEPYKYEWGAHDHPIQRILVTRTTRPT